MVASSSADVEVGPHVFINFRGAELRKTFVSHLDDALKRNGINTFIDSKEHAGDDLEILLKRIEESKVALAILSSRYTESIWCMKELVKIMECVEKDNLRVIPIFYELEPSTVKDLDGDFGIKLWNLWRKVARRNQDELILKWDAALQGLSRKFGLESTKSSDEVSFLAKIIEHVKDALTMDLSIRQTRGGKNPKPEEISSRAPNCIKQLEGKFDVYCNDNETRVVGIVGTLYLQYDKQITYNKVT